MAAAPDSDGIGSVDWDELLWMARVAMLNISPEQDVRRMFHEGTGLVVEVPEAHQRIVLGVDQKRGVQVVSLRGTRDRKSFVINLDARLERDAAREDAPAVHRGYSRAAALCLREVLPRLDPALPVVLTGHSMGGALAVVMALRLQEEGMEVQKVVTWGAPKVGPAGFKQAADKLNILRISQADDLVVYLPPTRLTGYRHLGTGLILTSATAPCFALLPPEESPCAVEALKKLLRIGADRDRRERFESHRMARYLRSVEQYAAAARGRQSFGYPLQMGEKDLLRLEGAARNRRRLASKAGDAGSSDTDGEEAVVPQTNVQEERPRRWMIRRGKQATFQKVQDTPEPAGTEVVEPGAGGGWWRLTGPLTMVAQRRRQRQQNPRLLQRNIKVVRQSLVSTRPMVHLTGARSCPVPLVR